MSSSLLSSPPMFICPATSSIHVCCLFFLYSHFLKSIKKITSNGFYLFFNKVDYRRTHKDRGFNLCICVQF
ncbi:hypothetical protein HanXRQr2_Chr13g0586831 [Helianthus annuus]|uniref:Uncharacterized protein n=1 Tax=Helianthus annuus TaxID=4232 RepID=A0A9K3HCD3_HELAN|nr:hypothetical protein HanXRQr2_Chr13g0586831 [Helianthus annuus]KAJ0849096.1 hypothetical protein HanPSC8_Chr13g0565001 [Helianthus annuus]